MTNTHEETMTNDEGTVVVVVDGHHQQAPEEIQLTELRPVEHSRINYEIIDGDDIKDYAATDGLKALRSFSRRNIATIEEFDFRNTDKIDSCFEKAVKNFDVYPRKRKFGRLKHLKELEPDQVYDKPYKSSKTACVNIIENDEDDENHQEEEEECSDIPEYYEDSADFEYLNGENEEIYIYRENEENPVDEEPIEKEPRDANVRTSRRINILRSTIVINGSSNTSSKAKIKKDASVTSKKKKNTRPVPPLTKIENVRKWKDDRQEQSDLQSKINDLIEANCLLEQENNNVEESDRNEKSRWSAEARKPARDEAKKYCCLVCKTRFKGSGGLRNHYKVVHGTGPHYKCDECGKEFPLKERLKLHVRTHTGFKPYKCTECDKSFARGGQLVQHRRTHSQVKPYSCDMCSGTFTCAANLALHVKRHNGQKDHKCDICGRGFVRRDALKKHLECLHRDVKSFLCKICNKTFKGHLPQHMRTHAQDRPHGCATCGQRFAQKSQLTVHQRTHSGQRPFRCLVCWQAFAHSTALKLHTRRHTGERPFKCLECNAGFTQLPHWKKHMKCIHGRSEPYCCKGCNKFFRIKNDLESHEKDCLPNDTSDESSLDESNNGPGSGKYKFPISYGPSKYRTMSTEKMRLLLAVLLKRISKQERLDELGFGKRLIDHVLVDSLVSAGKAASKPNCMKTECEALRENLAAFLEWTVPKEHWDNFVKMKKSPEEILETLTAT